MEMEYIGVRWYGRLASGRSHRHQSRLITVSHGLTAHAGSRRLAELHVQLGICDGGALMGHDRTLRLAHRQCELKRWTPPGELFVMKNGPYRPKVSIADSTRQRSTSPPKHPMPASSQSGLVVRHA